jgi:hypothetical protein
MFLRTGVLHYLIDLAQLQRGGICLILDADDESRFQLGLPTAMVSMLVISRRYQLQSVISGDVREFVEPSIFLWRVPGQNHKILPFARCGQIGYEHVKQAGGVLLQWARPAARPEVPAAWRPILARVQMGRFDEVTPKRCQFR